MTPRVVGLDLSLSATGIAWESAATALRTPAAKISGPARLVFIRRAVMGVVLVPRPADLVVLEGYSFGGDNRKQDDESRNRPGGMTRAFTTGELGGVIRVALWEAGVPYVEVAPGTLKVFACGNGKAQKPEVVSSARERLGYERYDDNEADALWLRAMGMHAMGAPLAELPNAHTRALASVQWPDQLVQVAV